MLEIMSHAPTNVGQHLTSNIALVCVANNTKKFRLLIGLNDVLQYDIS